MAEEGESHLQDANAQPIDDVRREKIASIKKALADGTYSVSAEEVARKLIEHMLEPKELTISQGDLSHRYTLVKRGLACRCAFCGMRPEAIGWLRGGANISNGVSKLLPAARLTLSTQVLLVFSLEGEGRNCCVSLAGRGILEPGDGNPLESLLS